MNVDLNFYNIYIDDLKSNEIYDTMNSEDDLLNSIQKITNSNFIYSIVVQGNEIKEYKLEQLKKLKFKDIFNEQNRYNNIRIYTSYPKQFYYIGTKLTTNKSYYIQQINTKKPKFYVEDKQKYETFDKNVIFHIDYDTQINLKLHSINEPLYLLDYIINSKIVLKTEEINQLISNYSLEISEKETETFSQQILLHFYNYIYLPEIQTDNKPNDMSLYHTLQEYLRNDQVQGKYIKKYWDFNSKCTPFDYETKIRDFDLIQINSLEYLRILHIFLCYFDIKMYCIFSLGTDDQKQIVSTAFGVQNTNSFVIYCFINSSQNMMILNPTKTHQFSNDLFQSTKSEILTISNPTNSLNANIFVIPYEEMCSELEIEKQYIDNFYSTISSLDKFKVNVQNSIIQLFENDNKNELTEIENDDNSLLTENNFYQNFYENDVDRVHSIIQTDIFNDFPFLDTNTSESTTEMQSIKSYFIQHSDFAKNYAIYKIFLSCFTTKKKSFYFPYVYKDVDSKGIIIEMNEYPLDFHEEENPHNNYELLNITKSLLKMPFIRLDPEKTPLQNVEEEAQTFHKMRNFVRSKFIEKLKEYGHLLEVGTEEIDKKFKAEDGIKFITFLEKLHDLYVDQITKQYEKRFLLPSPALFLSFINSFNGFSDLLDQSCEDYTTKIIDQIKHSEISQIKKIYECAILIYSKQNEKYIVTRNDYSTINFYTIKADAEFKESPSSLYEYKNETYILSSLIIELNDIVYALILYKESELQFNLLIFNFQERKQTIQTIESIYPYSDKVLIIHNDDLSFSIIDTNYKNRCLSTFYINGDIPENETNSNQEETEDMFEDEENDEEEQLSSDSIETVFEISTYQQEGENDILSFLVQKSNPQTYQSIFLNICQYIPILCSFFDRKTNTNYAIIYTKEITSQSEPGGGNQTSKSCLTLFNMKKGSKCNHLKYMIQNAMKIISSQLYLGIVETIVQNSSLTGRVIYCIDYNSQIKSSEEFLSKCFSSSFYFNECSGVHIGVSMSQKDQTKYDIFVFFKGTDPLSTTQSLLIHKKLFTNDNFSTAFMLISDSMNEYIHSLVGLDPVIVLFDGTGERLSHKYKSKFLPLPLNDDDWALQLPAIFEQSLSHKQYFNRMDLRLNDIKSVVASFCCLSTANSETQSHVIFNQITEYLSANDT